MVLDFERSRTYRLTVEFYFDDFNEVQKISEMLKLSASRVSLVQCSKRLNPTDRHRTILNTMLLGEKIRIGLLYRQLGRKYSLTYKTFQRDISILILNGNIIAEKSIGASGRTTYLIKQKEF
jgi:hypothetical protein